MLVKVTVMFLIVAYHVIFTGLVCPVRETSCVEDPAAAVERTLAVHPAGRGQANKRLMARALLNVMLVVPQERLPATTTLSALAQRAGVLET